ncbi:phosphatidylserine decarboxylase [Campylobacter sp. MIT 12-8780]|uniref:phosphatidylserine decarboxylase n=1 Tax=Campylobacter sp. MIT 12-8780 TaxID=2202200 RepID=UPI00115EE54F|nr:phosphatidylserine decarboxylase [Campylobacter sp. MIT 12-8780]TQR41029.1 phosphatidylserine decarboxylase [Campylobacter sp. MIT 12-8780]
MKISLVKSAFVLLITAVVVFVVVWIFWRFSWLLFFILLALFFIHRKPSRELVCMDKKAVLAPIDGKIIAIKNITHKDLGECIELDIKNLLYEAGVIYTSAALQVQEIKTRHGLFLPSSFELSKSLNERIFILAKQEKHLLATRICAGSLDRSIKIDNLKESYQAGEELGFTLNGTISLLLPKDTRLLVGVGDELKACTLLGYLS